MLADSAGQPRDDYSSYITDTPQNLPVAQAGILEAIGIAYSKPLSIEHDLLLSVKRSCWFIELVINSRETLPACLNCAALICAARFILQL